jgi:hypothetical protein
VAQGQSGRCEGEKTRNKAVPVLNKCHEGVWGSGRIEPRFLDLGTGCSRIVSFTPRPLYPRYPLDRRLCGPQNR